MDIATLCSAIYNALPDLKGMRSDKETNHKQVEKFQEQVMENLKASGTGYTWDKEIQAKGRSEKDSIDIIGQSKGQQNWIIEIDATRTDQVSQKLLSRLALWGQKEPIQYVAILYPDAQEKGQSACEKYLQYGNEVIKKVNKNSNVIGIFVDPNKNLVEVLQFGESSHFSVNGVECKNMNDAAAEAIRQYVNSHPVSYATLQKRWGKFVNSERGASRYKNVGVKTTDGVGVYSYTQFRQYGLCSYWSDFEKLCKKKGIRITKMKKVLVAGTMKSSFVYI